MRNFIQFLVKYHIFLFFLGLQVLCFWMIYKNNSFHEASFVNSSNRLIGTIYKWKGNVTEYIELQRENDELSAENEELRNRLKSNFVNVNDHFVMINDTLRERKYRSKSAQVVNSSINKQLNYLTINKGRVEGLKPEMGVVNKRGLVGVVKDVSEHFSTVLPIINLKFTASAELQRTGNFGLLRWDGRDFRYAYLNDVPRHADVHIGDTIITRGSSAIYPRGISVGIVSDVEAKEGTNFHKIRIELFNDFSKIRYVYVVENLLKEEQLEIEATTEEDGQ
ncbi:rod shape-determining protein MreC [Cryomorpha ignava]|uniref:Cell shape-determining protein MreC n=1 Tax=Cryomorpha ignava TaxID=101383 RepID=A0A7K3WN31_9FLAO|nr:rod shape-determining protein MreC [Cryomorpha ignava]NEN23046.1 rod shape-determining protein MreC [Cryomorpha ignava]